MSLQGGCGWLVLAISHWSRLGLSGASLSSGTVEGTMARRKIGEILGGRNGIFASLLHWKRNPCSVQMTASLEVNLTRLLTMLHGPLVILYTFKNEGVASVQDNVIFYNIFPFVSLSLKGNQASSTFLELTQPTEEAFIELLTVTPNLFPPRSLRAQCSSLYSWSGDYFCSLHYHTLVHVIAHLSSCCSVPVAPLNPADSWRWQPMLAFHW